MSAIGHHGLQTHLTRLAEALPSGEVRLASDDQAVQHKARQAQGHPEDTKTFVYWDGKAEKQVTGPVVTITEEPSFVFTVKALKDEPVPERPGIPITF